MTRTLDNTVVSVNILGVIMVSHAIQFSPVAQSCPTLSSRGGVAARLTRLNAASRPAGSFCISGPNSSTIHPAEEM